ncbi:hypothetical protein PAI11_03930 [Patulibacter medicamentivorans]|uniref:Polyketide cyclase/dehydrase n=1 Tax=Patulibacter medicamentivorans TaxID=1097667 RepID=H0E0T5_9ACTN|nr:SRPBCC family protein [Patulibacter medicamentivorans]EHN12699.1 hypothetical protein PAI11_03930 [Patulibacter medicamentivorans]
MTSPATRPAVVETAVETTAAATAVWALWADVPNWPRWDHALSGARLDGPFAPGSAGAMTVHGQGELAFTLTAIEPRRRFADRTGLPDGEVRFEHRIEPLEDGRIRVVHRAEVDAPEPIASAIASSIEQGLPTAVAALVALAERNGDDRAR